MRRILILAAAVLIATGAVWAFQEKSTEKTNKDIVKAEKTKDISEPVLVSKVSPKYPEEAKKNKVMGKVIVEAVVGTDGSVLDVKAIESPDPALSAAAIDAVKQWKYKPARNKMGAPVQVKITVTLNFQLK